MGRLGRAASVLALALIVSGCASAGAGVEEDAPPFWEVADDTISALDGVTNVLVGRTPITPGNDDADPTDLALWDVAIGVTLEDTIDVERAVAVTEAVHDYSAEVASPGRWSAEVHLRGAEAGAEDNVNAPILQVSVYPSEDSPGDSIRALFTARSAPGVVSVATGEGWPTVIVTDAAAFAPAHATLRILKPFSEGARYSTPDGRVILTDVPERITPESLAAIARLAVEAGHDGPRWPQLYVNRIGAAELEAFLAALNDPAMAHADPEGYPIEYFVRSFTDTGTVDSGGALGGVPLQ